MTIKLHKICAATLLAAASFTQPLSAKPLSLNDKQIGSPPPRIIRTCCSFGTDLRVMAIPGMKITEITDIYKIGPHRFLGNPAEGNGIVYTRDGGFIDLGHLRDQADWTAYLFALIMKNKGGMISQKLGNEGGGKLLELFIPEGFSEENAVLLAGKIAYDLSVWHEIATWFGASYVPLLPEKFSSFSVEDAYSNLMGAKLGMEAIRSELPFEEAMTAILSKELAALGAVSEKGTYEAMEAVREVWWTREKKLPSGKVLLEREMGVYGKVAPRLIPGWAGNQMVLNVPQNNAEGEPLDGFYKLSFHLNFRFPVKKMFPENMDRVVTQNDFSVLLQQVEDELKLQDARQDAKDERKEEKLAAEKDRRSRAAKKTKRI